MSHYQFISPTGKVTLIKDFPLTDHIEVRSVPIIYYYRLTPKLDFEGEKHDLYEFFLCLKGTIKITVEDKEYIVNENNYFVIPKNLMHKNNPDNSYTSSISIIFDASNIKDDLICLNAKEITPDENTLVKLITKNYYNNVPNLYYNSAIEKSSPLKNEYAFKQIIKNSLEMLLLLITRDFMHVDEKKTFKNRIEDTTQCKKIRDYINSNISGNITLKKLAKLFSYSESYLSRLFKKTYDETIINYINKTKIKECAKILFETDIPVNKIADQMGFNNVQYFTKLFKKYYGYTPATFRKETRITNIINALDANDEAF